MKRPLSFVDWFLIIMLIAQGVFAAIGSGKPWWGLQAFVFGVLLGSFLALRSGRLFVKAVDVSESHGNKRLDGDSTQNIFSKTSR